MYDTGTYSTVPVFRTLMGTGTHTVASQGSVWYRYSIFYVPFQQSHERRASDDNSLKQQIQLKNRVSNKSGIGTVRYTVFKTPVTSWFSSVEFLLHRPLNHLGGFKEDF
jgi:hypothetical protein